ncbi:MAG: hypothetical protein ABWK15_05580 [Dissulfuribacterales bacterium]
MLPEMDILIWAIVLCLVIVSVLSFVLVKRLKQTLDNVDKTLTTVNDAVSGLQASFIPFIERTSSLEDKASAVLQDSSIQLQRIEDSLLPLVADVRRLANTYERLGSNVDSVVNSRLPALVEDLSGVLRDVSAISQDIEDKFRKIDPIFQTVNRTGATINDVVSMVRPGALGMAAEIASITAGMRTALNFLIHKRKEK